MIDWSIVAEALHHYGQRGFREVDVPWMVRAAAYDATKPPDSKVSQVMNYGDACYLVASGEQSLLDMWDAGQLPPIEQMMCVTPCFRVEPVPDELHLPYFLKLELMHVIDPGLAGWVRGANVHLSAGRYELYQMIFAAEDFFQRRVNTRRRELPDGSIDIETLDGIELGSYGVRDWRGLRWVYGTGVALPRLQQAVKAERETGR